MLRSVARKTRGPGRGATKKNGGRRMDERTHLELHLAELRALLGVQDTAELLRLKATLESFARDIEADEPPPAKE